ncbi:hypothetical protein BaRGS_00007222 [Batillaria attramentaria]|uniref:Uncharacterized protein n=1 Tax=Batillaria attramentaria TaxID=370345 RepID=A0ABD0LQA2_9CAEN
MNCEDQCLAKAEMEPLLRQFSFLTDQLSLGYRNVGVEDMTMPWMMENYTPDWAVGRTFVQMTESEHNIRYKIPPAGAKSAFLIPCPITKQGRK